MYNREINLKLLNINNTESHIHKGLECILVISGCVDIEIDGKRLILNQDDIVVININQLHTIYGNSSNLVLSLFVEKDYLLRECGELANHYINCNSANFGDKNDQKYSELKSILIRMKKAEIEKEQGYELNFRILLLRLLYTLFIHFKGEQTQALSTEPSHISDFSVVLAYMHENYNKSIGLKELADYMFMSPHYFSKQFKKKFGVGFLQYLQKIRLDNAMKSLLYGDDSILKIALDNGFANQKSFSEVFMKIYNDRPSAFRNRHKSGEALENLSSSIYEEDYGDDIMAFLRYIKKYDTYSNYPMSSDVTYSINIAGKMIRQFKKQNNIINIDKIDTALRTDFSNSLRDKFDLGIQYVYFRLILEENQPWWNHNLLHGINIFHNNGLVPIFKISLKDLNLALEAAQLQEISKKITPMLQILQKQFPLEYIRKWMFEITFENIPTDKTFSFYRECYLTIKKTLPFSKVGMFSVNDDLPTTTDEFQDRLHFTAMQNCKPDFVTFSVFPNRIKTQYLPDIDRYPTNGYYKKIAYKVKEICEKLSCTNMPLYMINWNTITAGNIPETNVYFRSALILEALLEVNELINGVGYWFETSMSNDSSGEAYFSALALYIHSGKRPVYFVVEALMRMGNEVLFESDHILTTMNDEGEIIIMVWNPSFLNPSYCLDNSNVDHESIKLKIELTGVEKANYRFKKININRDTSGAVARLMAAGYPDINDKDAIEYLNSAPGKELTVFEEKISDGAYTLESTVKFNGIIVYIMKRIE